jgi:uncharacterized protein YkwD
MRALYVGFLAILFLIAGFYLYFGNISSGVSVEPQVLGVSSGVIDVEQQLFLDKINEIRLSAGSEKLIYDEKLEKLAVYRVEDMVERKYYSHTTPESTTYADYLDDYKVESGFSCENLQLQVGSDINQAIDAWQKSSSHYKCLIEPRLRTIGFSHQLYETVSGDNGQKQLFVFSMIAVQ